MPNPIPTCVGSIAESESAAIGAVAGTVVGPTRWAPSAYATRPLPCCAARAARSNQSGLELTTETFRCAANGGPLEPVGRTRHGAVEAVLPEGRGSSDGERGDGDCDDE